MSVAVLIVVLACATLPLGRARDIVFPTVAGLGSVAAQEQLPLADLGDVDIVTGSQFSGLTTYANLPYTNCFGKERVEKYDIAIVGAAFDTVCCLIFRLTKLVCLLQAPPP